MTVAVSASRMGITTRTLTGARKDGKRKRRKKSKRTLPHMTRMETGTAPEGWKRGKRRIPEYTSRRMAELVHQLVGIACRRGQANIRGRDRRLERARDKRREWLEYSSRMEWADSGEEDERIAKRRSRMERATARKIEWWTDHLLMDWDGNDSTKNILCADMCNVQCSSILSREKLTPATFLNLLSGRQVLTGKLNIKKPTAKKRKLEVKPSLSSEQFMLDYIVGSSKKRKLEAETDIIIINPRRNKTVKYTHEPEQGLD
jgi:hypothetical protein